MISGQASFAGPAVSSRWIALSQPVELRSEYSVLVDHVTGAQVLAFTENYQPNLPEYLRIGAYCKTLTVGAKVIKRISTSKGCLILGASASGAEQVEGAYLRKDKKLIHLVARTPAQSGPLRVKDYLELVGALEKGRLP